MATTAIITENSTQGSRRRVFVTYTADGGAIGKRGPMYLPLNADVQAIADSFIARYDTGFERREKKDALLRFFNGEDMDVLFDTGYFKILTRNDVRRVCLRRAANRMVSDDVENLAACSTWVNTLTDTIVAARLTNANATWSNTEAGQFKSALLALADSQSGLDHGKGEQDEN